MPGAQAQDAAQPPRPTDGLDLDALSGDTDTLTPGTAVTQRLGKPGARSEGRTTPLARRQPVTRVLRKGTLGQTPWLHDPEMRLHNNTATVWLVRVARRRRALSGLLGDGTSHFLAVSLLPSVRDAQPLSFFEQVSARRGCGTNLLAPFRSCSSQSRPPSTALPQHASYNRPMSHDIVSTLLSVTGMLRGQPHLVTSACSGHPSASLYDMASLRLTALNGALL